MVCALGARAGADPAEEEGPPVSSTDAHTQSLSDIIPDFPTGGLDAKVGEVLTNLTTALPAAYNAFSGFYRHVPITVEYKGKPCTIPFTFHKNVFGKNPTLMLHGMTDTGEAYHPYVKRAKKSPQGNKHFVMVDWPRNGIADCGQAMTAYEASEATYLAYESWMKQLNHYARTNHLPAIGLPGEIMAHSLGTIEAAHLATNPRFKSIFGKAKLTLLAVPALEPTKMKKDLVDFVHGIQDKNKAAVFLKRTQTSWAHPFTDLAQASPLFGTVILKRATGASHLGRIDRNRVYTDSLFEPVNPDLLQGLPPTPTKIVTNYDFDRAALLALAPERTQIFLGTKDKLTPAQDVDPEILKKFELQTTYIKCGHNIQRDCDKQLFELLHPKPPKDEAQK